jgi:hypothetical protein
MLDGEESPQESCKLRRNKERVIRSAGLGWTAEVFEDVYFGVSLSKNWSRPISIAYTFDMDSVEDYGAGEH